MSTEQFALSRIWQFELLVHTKACCSLFIIMFMHVIMINYIGTEMAKNVYMTRKENVGKIVVLYGKQQSTCLQCSQSISIRSQ